ncbi:hypothetical protein M0804_011781 [Polistes exclamans]|nr:hypothetical protein M0804_011781 [Polistes exclamans]
MHHHPTYENWTSCDLNSGTLILTNKFWGKSLRDTRKEGRKEGKRNSSSKQQQQQNQASKQVNGLRKDTAGAESSRPAPTRPQNDLLQNVNENSTEKKYFFVYYVQVVRRTLR